MEYESSILERLPLTREMRACLRRERSLSHNLIACLVIGMAAAILIALTGASRWIEQSPLYLAIAVLAIALAASAPLVWARLQVQLDLQSATYSRYAGAFYIREDTPTSQIEASDVWSMARSMTWVIVISDGELTIPLEVVVALAGIDHGEIDFATHQKVIFEIRDGGGNILFRNPNL